MSLGFALRYAEMNWHVIPVDHLGRPLVALEEATRYRPTIQEWWWNWPEAGVSVVLGPSGLIALETANVQAFKRMRATIGEFPLLQQNRRLIGFFKETVKGTPRDKDVFVWSGLSHIPLPPQNGRWLVSPFITPPPEMPKKKSFFGWF